MEKRIFLDGVMDGCFFKWLFLQPEKLNLGNQIFLVTYAMNFNVEFLLIDLLFKLLQLTDRK